MSDDLRTDTMTVNHKIIVAWDRAGSMPAKQAVKVHPPDWHWMRDALVALCKERDALRTQLQFATELAKEAFEECTTLRARLATAEADAMEMWKALKPFADQAEVFAAADDALSFPDSFRVAIAGHTVGDLRHARVICNDLKPKEQE